MDGTGMNEEERNKLKQTADIKPSRLEKRLARNELSFQQNLDGIKGTGMQNGTKTALSIIGYALSLLGIIAALIPTLLYFALISLPLFLLYTCVSHF